MIRTVLFKITSVAAIVLAATVALMTTGTSATATQGQAVIAGHVNAATDVTIVNNTDAGASCPTGDSLDGLTGCGYYGVNGQGTNVGVEGVGGTYGARGFGGPYGVVGSGSTYGVWGDAGAYASSYGVYGTSTTGDGVRGEGKISGVYGFTDQGYSTGVHGQATAYRGYGVYGEAGDPAGFGVYGTGTATTGPAYGVYGQSSSASGYGVYGMSPSTGVYGKSTASGGVGVYATGTSTGLALRAADRVRFSTAGITVVPAGAKKVTVTMAGVTGKDFVLATVQGNTASSVQGAKAGAGQFTIWLDASASIDTTVAYFVISGA